MKAKIKLRARSHAASIICEHAARSLSLSLSGSVGPIQTRLIANFHQIFKISEYVKSFV